MNTKTAPVLIATTGLVLGLSPLAGHAGAYISSDEDCPGCITHAHNYKGGGGAVYVEVCIDATAANADAMAIPIQNIVKEINRMTSASPNLAFGGSTNIPSGKLDFESLTLHELGHCIGLGHPNMGLQEGVESGETDYTAAADGANDQFDFAAGTDAIPGSNDDARTDDVNLHWFEIGVNDPFLDVTSPDATNYSRDLADLPGSHAYAENADRDIGALRSSPNTEAVMQQGQYLEEDQRALQADDVNTLKFAMTGFDETAGTGDDYTINMVYGGIRADTDDCDIVVDSDVEGFAYCSVGYSWFTSNPEHNWITAASFYYNSTRNDWFFNPVLDTTCSVGDTDLVISSATHNDKRYHQACNSITYGPSYTIGASGDVTAIAQTITLGPGTSISGKFRAILAVP